MKLHDTIKQFQKSSVEYADHLHTLRDELEPLVKTYTKTVVEKLYLDQFELLDDIDRYTLYKKWDEHMGFCKFTHVGFDENTNLDGDAITFECEDYWAYGGYDSGHLTIPIEHLLDNVVLINFLDGVLKEIGKEVGRLNQNYIKREETRIARLKK